MRLIEYLIYLFIIIAISGCGVGWLPELSKEKLLTYKSVIDLSRDRYANFRSSFGMSKFKVISKDNTKVCTFQIATNNVREKNSLDRFIKDMGSYCHVIGGDLESLIEINKHRKLELINKYTSNKLVNIQPCFECGPIGRGTISCDWTKFNPQICRKLPDTSIKKEVNWNKVNKEFGMPSDFICRKNNGAFFVGSVSRISDGDVVLFNIRLNENEGSLITGKNIIRMK